MQTSSNVRQIAISMLVILLSVVAMLGLAGYSHKHEFKPTPYVAAPAPAAQAGIPEAEKQYVAALDVARVFGRSSGCAEADVKLIGDIAAESLRVGISPRILAATVAVESSCDSMAVSRRGAVGLTQIMPKIWRASFDFEHTVNLFNPAENLHAGATILSNLIKQYGLTEGIRHYQGTGTDCSDCDNNYVPKILSLAGMK